MMSNPLFDDPRVVHLRFADITSDPVGSVRRIYERAGLPTSETHLQRMQAWLADPGNRADRYGRYPYTPEPFGLTKEWLAELFGEYHHRVGIAD